MTSTTTAIWRWLEEQWVYAGAVAGAFLLALFPLLWFVWPKPILLIYAQVPVYMAHQLEEHHRDRFRAFVNQRMAGGREALTRSAVVVINVGMVWMLDFAALYLALFVNPAFGLIASYLTVINALIHIVTSIATRSYNPGLWTSLALFLPVGGWATAEIGRGEPHLAMYHAGAAAFIAASHVAIAAHVRRRAISRT